MGCEIHQVLNWSGPLTHRQFRTWMAWLTIDQIRPRRTEHYLVRLMVEVAKGYAKQGTVIDSSQFYVKLNRKGGTRDGAEDVQRATQKAKTVSMARVHGKIRHVQATQVDPVTGQAIASTDQLAELDGERQ